MPLRVRESLNWLRGKGKVASPRVESPRQPVCQFSETWTPAPLVSRVWVCSDVMILVFGLPDGSQPLGLSDVYIPCVLCRGGRDPATGEPYVRPYTPMDPSRVGNFGLNVKVYEDGKLSKHLATLKIGDCVDFRHVPMALYRKRFVVDADRVGVVCCGTGITTGYQAIERVLRKAKDVSLLYGSRNKESILARDELERLQSAHPKALTVTHVLSQEPKASSWDGHRGRIGKALLKAHLPDPRTGTVIIYVCGPNDLCDALCGPPTDDAPTKKRAKGLLGDLGYAANQVCRL